MIRELERVLLSNWEEFGCPGSRPRQLAYILSGERHRHSKVIVYCLPEERNAPPLVAKIQRADMAIPQLDNEYVQLKALHALPGLEEMRGSIPKPLFFGELAGHHVMIETYLPGVPFSKHLRRKGPRCLHWSFEWLTAFHARTVKETRRLTAGEIEIHFLAPLESAIGGMDALRPFRPFLMAYRRRIEALADITIPVVFCHHDLCLNNIRFHKDAVGVIDWEFARYPDLPFLDVINLFLFSAMTWKGLRYPKAFALAFAENGGLSTLLKRMVREYCETLRLDPGLVGPLVVQYLISRISLLGSIGSTAGVEDSIRCLAAVATGQVDLQRWTDLPPGA